MEYKMVESGWMELAKMCPEGSKAREAALAIAELAEEMKREDNSK